MAKPYTLTVGPAETAAANPWGDFQLIRPFVLKGPKTSGFIVQLIERTATVIVHRAKPEELTTSEKISSFTSRNVQNAVGSYYEIFMVKDGKVLDRDQFQGGQILEYPRGSPDDRTKTEGTIRIIGTSVFIPGDIAGVEAASEASERVATRSMTRVNLLGQTWDTFADTPANGLPFLSGAVALPLKDLARSNTLVRTCTVSWGVDGQTTLTETTVPKSTPVKVVSATGGRRRSTRGRPASKSLRTRRTGRARRRSRRQA